MSATEAVQAAPARRSLRPLRVRATITAILALLFGLPWWTLVAAGTRRPAIVVAGTIVFVSTLVAFTVLMYLGHGSRHRDWAPCTGNTILGVIWIMFVWALLGNVLRSHSLSLASLTRSGPGSSPRRSPLCRWCWCSGGTPRRCACPASSAWTSRFPV